MDFCNINILRYLLWLFFFGAVPADFGFNVMLSALLLLHTLEQRTNHWGCLLLKKLADFSLKLLFYMCSSLIFFNVFFLKLVLIFDSYNQLLSGRHGLILSACLLFSFSGNIRKPLLAKTLSSISFTKPSCYPSSLLTPSASISVLQNSELLIAPGPLIYFMLPWLLIILCISQNCPFSFA